MIMLTRQPIYNNFFMSGNMPSGRPIVGLSFLQYVLDLEKLDNNFS